MSAYNAAKKPILAEVPAKSLLNRLTPGKRLKLRDDVYKQVKEREWIFKKMDSQGIHLVNGNNLYGLIVEPSDIDWKEFRLRRVK